METVLFELSTFRFVSKTGFIRVYKGRSFPLESSTFRYNPLCSFKQGGIPFL